MEVQPVNVDKWVRENKSYFLPPVCNKLMHNNQLTVMFVGGPNQRKDYHIEEGEEFFYQLEGDMCLKIMENGEHKDIHIKEGEMFLLPARIPHSPQRFAHTVGLVFERRRSEAEFDGLRFYVDNSNEVLYEKWFHSKDLGVELAPIIKEFCNSKQYKTGKPDPEMSERDGLCSENRQNEVFVYKPLFPFRETYSVSQKMEVMALTEICELAEDQKPEKLPFPLNTDQVMEPFSFKSWLDTHRTEIERKKRVSLVEDRYDTKAAVYGSGEMSESTLYTDNWIWQLEGRSVIAVDGKDLTLGTGDSLLIPRESKFSWKRHAGCIAFCIRMEPAQKKE